MCVIMYLANENTSNTNKEINWGNTSELTWQIRSFVQGMALLTALFSSPLTILPGWHPHHSQLLHPHQWPPNSDVEASLQQNLSAHKKIGESQCQEERTETQGQKDWRGKVHVCWLWHSEVRGQLYIINLLFVLAKVKVIPAISCWCNKHVYSLELENKGLWERLRKENTIHGFFSRCALLGKSPIRALITTRKYIHLLN